MKKIEYVLRLNKRAKCLRLSVNCKGVVLITCPVEISHEKIENIMLRKIDWILRQVTIAESIQEKRQLSSIEYKKTYGDALALIKSRVEYYGVRYGFDYKKITIRNQRKRWGSCSKKGNLNFNYKIAKLPPEITDYVVVHELCHLAEFNHSKKFWSLVEKAIPRYKELRSELKRTSLQDVVLAGSP